MHCPVLESPKICGRSERLERASVCDSPIAPKMLCDNENLKSTCSGDLEKLMLQRALLRHEMRLGTMQEKLTRTEDNFQQFKEDKETELAELQESLVQSNEIINQCNQEINNRDKIILAQEREYQTLRNIPGLGALLFIHSIFSLTDFYAGCVVHWVYDLCVLTYNWFRNLGRVSYNACEAAILKLREVAGNIFFEVVKVILFPVFELTDAILLYVFLAIGLLEKSSSILQQEKDQMGNNIKQGKNDNKNGEDDMNGNGEETINRNLVGRSEPASKPGINPASKPINKSARMLFKGPNVNPVRKPANVPAREQGNEPASELVNEPASEPVIERAIEPVNEPASEPVNEPDSNIANEAAKKKKKKKKNKSLKK